MRRVFALALLVVSCASAPTMPLTVGAEKVRVLDADSIEEQPFDLKPCRALGQRVVGPVEWDNMKVAIQNETYAAGGDLFFATAYEETGFFGELMTVTGMVYRCGTTTP